MFSALSSPYPCSYGTKESYKVAFFVGLFVALFLLGFKPFGVAISESYLVIKILGYGIVSFLCMATVLFLGPKLFPNYFEEKNYTLGRDLIASAITILLIGICNWVYLNAISDGGGLKGSIIMIGQTFLVGVFPFTFISLLQYNSLLKKNLKASQEIKVKHLSISERDSNDSAKVFRIKSDGENSEITSNLLIYIESIGNYVNVVSYNNEQINRNLYRSTLKSIENQNKVANIRRCHRSYIVNLNKVESIDGNAQGLRLSLLNSDEVIPVSRKYIPDIKNYFDQL